MTGLLVGAAFVGLALLATRYGADTRDGSDWQDHRDARDRVRQAGRHTIGSDLRSMTGLFGRAAGFLAQRWDAQERAWAACWRAHQPWRGDDPVRSVGGVPDELRWEPADGGWRLTGRLLPHRPPDRPSNGPERLTR